MDLVAERSRESLATKGSGALGFYTTGQLFLEDYYTLALIARGGIGTNHLDGNTRLCTATAGQSLKESFGCDGQPSGVHDIEYCDTILHVGINTAETQTVLWMHELDRLRGPDPPRSVVIDPRETESAREAHVHLAIRPGTNLAVLNGLARELIENRSEEHTSELQSQSNLVCRLLLEKKKNDVQYPVPHNPSPPATGSRNPNLQANIAPLPHHHDRRAPPAPCPGRLLHTHTAALARSV